MAILFDWYENPKTKDKQGEELNCAGIYKNTAR